MKVYFSGISGTGIGPLALFAKKSGHEVTGSDRTAGAIMPELTAAGITVHLGPQDGTALSSAMGQGLDWFVYTSALPSDHEELVLAREYAATHPEFKVTKRDDFTAYLIDTLGLKLIAIAGTHGKTTTTSMLVYAATELGLPAAHVVGTTLGFAPSGDYHGGDEYFIYEADEYDRNFLKFHPWLAVFPHVSYDHPDIYPTESDYLAAFDQFKSQCHATITPSDLTLDPLASFPSLAGPARRLDAALAATAISRISPSTPVDQICEILDTFPGVGRRFERLSDNVYSDYAHHPEEIAATIAVATDAVKSHHKKGLVVIYEPHQNTRQHEVRSAYHDAFNGADHLYWLPTYLTREDPSLPVITPAEFIAGLNNPNIAEPAELDDALFSAIRKYAADDYLVLLMAAGPADPWLRERLQNVHH